MKHIPKIRQSAYQFILLVLSFGALCHDVKVNAEPGAGASPSVSHSAQTKMSDADWKKRLSSAQFNVMRQKGTEVPYSGHYNNFYEAGTYRCAACGNVLFTSKAKFDAHEGWPSFYQPASPSAVTKLQDNSIMMMPRTEIECAKCGSHLGHVFDDGPKPTGLRYCINSVCLNFDKASEK